MNDYQNMYSEAPAMTVPEVREKEPVVYTKSERITAILMLVCGFLWVRLCLYHASGIFTTLLYAAIITAQLIFLKKNGAVFTKSEKLTAAVLYGFSLVYTITANELLKGLNTVFLIMVGSLFLFHTANPDGDILRYLPVSLAKGGVAAPFRNFIAAPQSLTSGAKSGGFWKTTGYIVLGLLLAVPVTMVAAVLLCSADENMAHLIRTFSKLPSEELLTLIPHLLVGLLIGCMIFSALYTASHKELHNVPENCEDLVRGCRMIPTPVIYAMVTPLCALYILFFFSQMQYFLGGFTGDIAEFTYAEYARRGFFELCGVCVLNAVVIGGIGFFARRKDGRKPLTLRLYSGFLSISSLLLAGTALAKMFLYIRMYGMTQLRIYTTWFMLLLVIFFTLLLVRQFKDSLNIGKILMVSLTVMFALLCFSRPDAWMTRYNAEMYLSGHLEEFDSSVLSDMSDDAWSALTAYDTATVDRLLTKKNVRPQFVLRTQRNNIDFWENLNLSAWELAAYGNHYRD